MKRGKLVFGILLLQLLTNLTTATNLDDIIFRTISPQGGFTDRGVEKIIQDHLEFIWIATLDGLYKYDTYTFTKYVYDSEDSLSLSNDRIHDLLIDSENRLWVATDEGLNLYNRAMDGFELINPGADNPYISIGDIEQDLDGCICVSSGSMLYRYNPDTKTSSSLMLPYGEMRKINIRKDGQIIIAFNNNGVFKISDAGEPEQIIPPFKNSLRTAFFTDSTIYLGYENEGLYVYDSDGKFIERYTVKDGSISHGKVNAILHDSKGNIWVGTYLGLDVISPLGQILHFTKDMPAPYALPYSSVFTIYEDSRENLWVGTWSGGLAYYNRYDNMFDHIKQQKGINSISNDYVSCFTTDEDGDLWVGTERGGLNWYQKDADLYSNYELRNDRSEHLNIKSLLHTGDNHIYIGTFKGGFYYLDQNDNPHRIFLDQMEADDERVYAIRETEEGIWVGDYSNGLYLISKKDQRILRHYTQSNDSLGLTSQVVTALFSDQGDLWVGTSRGLNLKPAGKDYFIKFLPDKEDPTTISSNIITMIERDLKGNIWIGTRRGGLNKYLRKENAFIHYKVNDGLSGNDANGILCDQSGSLWVSTENGISRIDPVDGSINNYNISDGLQGNQFNRGSAYRSPDGKLYFGGTNGYTIIHPDQVKINPLEPTPIIFRLYINNRKMNASSPDSPLTEAISEVGEIRLKHFQSSISLEFTTNNYLNPSKNRYAYRIVGFNDVWQYSAVNQVSYSNLTPGNYTFELRAANNDGIWSKKPTRLNISISPPWWKHFVAYIIYSLLTIGIIIVILSMILNRERMKSVIVFETLKRENKEKIHQLKLQFFTNISHEFKTPLTLILSPIQRLVRDPGVDPAVREDLLLAEKNANRLKKLVNQFIEFRKIDQTKLNLTISKNEIVSLSEEIFSFFRDLALKKKIDYSLNQQIEPVELWFDVEKLENAIFNIISNAFKYTPEGGQILFSIKRGTVQFPETWKSMTLGDRGNKQFIMLEISDTGNGIPEAEFMKIFERFYRAEKTIVQSGSGIGLSLAKDYILLHNGILQLASKQDEGSIFTIGIPIGKDHFMDQPNVNFIDQHQSALLNRDSVLLNQEDALITDKTIDDDKDKSLLLLIEDNQELNQYLTKTLSEQFRVVHSLNGEEGLSLASRLLPELIISDIMLPCMTGLELCQKVKSDPLTSHIPVVLITALSENQEKIIGIDMGADAYLTKPLDIQMLFSTVHNLIEARKKLRLAYGGIQAAVDKAEGLSAFDSILIKRARAYIEDNITNPDISTTQLASELNMSRTNLHRKLKSLVDQSSTEFIRNIRINRAMELMAKEGINISEVCYAVGFTSTSYFSKCFKEIYRINPSEYKRNLGVIR